MFLIWSYFYIGDKIISENLSSILFRIKMLKNGVKLRMDKKKKGYYHFNIIINYYTVNDMKNNQKLSLSSA